MDSSMFNLLCYIWLGIAIAVHILMFFVTAPFGRHSRSGWGSRIPERLAWLLMELPSFLIMAGFLVFGTRSWSSYAWVLFFLWLTHYSNRCFLFPLRMRANPKGMPLSIMLMAVAFNLVNASINGYFLAELADPQRYTHAWLFSPRAILGLVLFVGGMLINITSDSMLINLRKKGESGYTLPRGFLFEYVTAPNLFGEIVEWAGFALMAWNLPALCFFAWTCANLIPRAKNHRDWSRQYFPDFPTKRKIIIPFLF